jgi:predicted transposase YbfD/YdcC
LEKFIACWDGVDDPRTGNAALHDFHEILIIAMCAVPGGGQGSVDMGLFAKSKEPFLRGFLKLAHGVPSHDTEVVRSHRGVENRLHWRLDVVMSEDQDRS